MDQGDARRDAGVRELVACAVDAVNRRDVDAFASLWAPDGRWELPELGVVEGREAIAAALLRRLEPMEVLVQLAPNGVLDLRAFPISGRWWMSESGRRRDGGHVQVFGTYTDAYDEASGGWWFTSRRFEVVYDASDRLTGNPPRS